MVMHMLLHTVKTRETREKIFTKMLKDVGMEVPKGIKSNVQHAGKGRV